MVRDGKVVLYICRGASSTRALDEGEHLAAPPNTLASLASRARASRDPLDAGGATP